MSAPTHDARTRVGEPLPTAAALRLMRDRPGPFVLYERGGSWSLGLGARHEVVVRAGGVELRSGGEVRRRLPADRHVLRRVGELAAEVGAPGSRAYGWAAFELAHLLRGGPVAAGQPLLHLVLPEHEVRSGPAGTDVRTGDGTDPAALVAALTAAPGTAPPAPLVVDERQGGAAYRAAVAAAIDDIRAGRLLKVILSRVVEVDEPVDLVATYSLGRRDNTPARSYLLDVGGLRAAGFSPETVVEVGAGGEISTQPLAGTRALSGDRETDGRLRAELVDDPKEVFEHAISVRDAQAELTGLCAPGSVRVAEFMAVKDRGSVQHLASRVSGRLGAGVSGWDALGRLFPAITVTGVPKPAALEAIRRHETEPRGMYGGVVLTADADGALDAALVLRTVFQRGGRTWLRAGAGIVGPSDPARELEESCEKLRSVSRFLVPARVRAEHTAPVGGSRR
ncbi:salicylate synthase [Pseudonocardia lacus]|uniref:salicylate synthase n=1 Tax=Pseudonocardia lacus TaxID=2835865 RepID=UPI001BDD3934|nr:salicylate synthase [Pseudonocardia lacus]